MSAFNPTILVRYYSRHGSARKLAEFIATVRSHYDASHWSDINGTPPFSDDTRLFAIALDRRLADTAQKLTNNVRAA